MAEPFATLDDLIVRWRYLGDDEANQAAALLGDASAVLRTVVRDVDARLEASLLDPVIPKMVVCAMVKRAMLAGSNGDGVSSMQDQTGPFMQQVTFANPLGNLYLTKADMRALGVGGQRAFSIDTMPPVP